MAKDKLSREHLEQLRKISGWLEIIEFFHNAGAFYADFWKVQKIKEKGLDMSVPYEISLETGVIKPQETFGVEQKEPKKDGEETSKS